MLTAIGPVRSVLLAIFMLMAGAEWLEDAEVRERPAAEAKGVGKGGFASARIRGCEDRRQGFAIPGGFFVGSEHGRDRRTDVRVPGAQCLQAPGLLGGVQLDELFETASDLLPAEWIHGRL